ncbi:MAG TPA: ABC transporter permease [Anaerolineales bacterium]|nr:ABC transporter permease [Anaerolineales bacterium]
MRLRIRPEDYLGVFCLSDFSQSHPGPHSASRSSPLATLAFRLLPAILALAAWELASRWSNWPPFLLPGPADVASTFVQVVRDGSLQRHTAVTLLEVIVGLTLGSLLALGLAYPLARSRRADRLLSPYIVASQAVPTVAIAPLLVIWFGNGLLSKVLVCALIVFFPVLVNTVVGLRSVPEDLRDLMRSLRATRWQVFRHLEVPSATPSLLGGLKIGATLSVIGAVVGEFVGAEAGLGFLINQARGLYNTPLVFAALATLMTMALALYGLVAVVERLALAWRRR